MDRTADQRRLPLSSWASLAVPQILLLLLLAACSSKEDGRSVVGAKLTVEREMLNLGAIGSWAKVEMAYTLHNVGTEKAIIDKVQAGCSCNTVALPDGGLEPGRTFVLKVGWDPRRYIGKQRNLLTINYNSRDEMPLVIGFTAEVVEILQVSPNHLNIDTSSEITGRPQRITISSREKTPLQVTRVQVPAYLRYTVCDRDPEKNEVGILFELTDDRLPPSVYKDTIVIHTSEKKQNTIEMLSFVTIGSALVANPASLFLDMVDGTPRREESRISLSRKDGQPFAISQVRSRTGGLKFQYSHEQSPVHSLHISGWTESEGAFEDIIEVVGEEGARETVKVPIAWRLR